MSEALRGKVFLTLAIIALQAVQGVAFEEIRVEPAQEAASKATLTAEQAWEWKEKFCPEPAIHLSVWQSQSCQPPGALCGWDSQCCSGSCGHNAAWECD